MKAFVAVALAELIGDETETHIDERTAATVLKHVFDSSAAATSTASSTTVKGAKKKGAQKTPTVNGADIDIRHVLKTSAQLVDDPGERSLLGTK